MPTVGKTLRALPDPAGHPTLRITIPTKASGVDLEQGGTFPDGDLLDINLVDATTLFRRARCDASEVADQSLAPRYEMR
jgi:hypothetical protein